MFLFQDKSSTTNPICRWGRVFLGCDLVGLELILPEAEAGPGAPLGSLPLVTRGLRTALPTPLLSSCSVSTGQIPDTGMGIYALNRHRAFLEQLCSAGSPGWVRAVTSSVLSRVGCSV